MNKTLVLCSLMLAFNPIAQSAMQIKSTTPNLIKPTESQLIANEELPTYMQWTELDEEQSKQWHLKKKDWLKYKRIMAISPRGKWSPDLDPVTVLGVEAKSDAEREKYARIWVKLEEQRQMNETAFDFAIQQVAKEKYPDAGVFKSYRQVAYPEQSPGLVGEAFGIKRRTVLFADAVNCDLVCMNAIAGIVSSNGGNHQLDMFVLNTDGSDDVLRAFATSIRIPQGRVDSGRLTLNHDHGSFVLSGIQESLPVMVHIDSNGETIVPLVN